MSGNGEAHGGASSDQAIGTDTSSVLSGIESVPASKAQSFDAVEAEGNEARWKAAKETALAVFNSPALVTPRRITRLGEEGLAAFVDEVRSIAQAYIRRERSRQAETPPQTSEPVGKGASRKEQPKLKLKLRRPAPFGVAQPVKQTFVRLKDVKAFVSDLLFGSLSAVGAIVIAILIYRFLSTAVH